MTIKSHVLFFQAKAQDHVTMSTQMLAHQYDLMDTPYYSAQYHGISFLYPFCHALKTLASLGRILKGGVLLIASLFEDPTNNIPCVLLGIAMETGAFIMNILNTALSAISLITRSLSTLFTFGYFSTHISDAEKALSGKEIGGRNAETTRNFIAGTGLGFMDRLIESVEQELYENTSNLTL